VTRAFLLSALALPASLAAQDAPIPDALRGDVLVTDDANPPAAATPAQAAPWPWVEPAPAQAGGVTVFMAGDTNLLRESVDDGLDALRFVAPTMRAADIAFLNLEAVPSGSTAMPYSEDVPHKPGWRHAHPAMAEVMARAGVDGVGLANNGAFPRLATVRAMEALDAAGVRHVGAGMTDAEARAPLVFERGGETVGFLQYTLVYWPHDQEATADLPGIATVASDKLLRPHPRFFDRPMRGPQLVTVLDPESVDRLRADVARLADAADVSIVQFHWSVTGREDFAYQHELARVVAEAGGDLVVGHGPHRLQNVEMIGDVPVVHSLANFAFDWDQMDKAPEGLVARVVVRDGAIRRLSLVPVLRDADDRPILLDPREGYGAALTRELRALSTASLSVEGAEIVVDLSPSRAEAR
jgi:poly-gamma-glutamate synthesis protein (capsule biosynthesis protein)